MTFTLALMIAVSYWGARDIQTPCHPYPVAASRAEMAAIPTELGVGAYMAAEQTDCQILVSPLANRDVQPGGAYITYCTAIVHEVGHIDGLGHTSSGVMTPYGGYQPWGCVHPRRWLQRHRHHGRIVLTNRPRLP